MAAPERTPLTSAYLADNWFLVPAVANLKAPTVAELTAADALDITLRVFADGSTWPTSETGTTQLPALYGDSKQYQAFDRRQVNGGTLMYGYTPQGATGSAGRKMYEALPQGRELVLVNRLGVDQNEDIEAAQEVSLYRIKVDKSVPARAGEGTASVTAQSVTYIVLEDETNVKVAA